MPGKGRYRLKISESDVWILATQLKKSFDLKADRKYTLAKNSLNGENVF